MGPLSLFAYIPRPHVTAEGKKFTREVQAVCGKQLAEKKRSKLIGPVAVTVKLYFKDRRVRDIDNHFKPLLDALKNVAFEDDGKVFSIYAAKFSEWEEDKIEVSIVPLPDCTVSDKPDGKAAKKRG